MKLGIWRQLGPLAAIVAAVLGMLVWAAFGRDHTKTMTVTKTVTKQAPNPKFSGPQSLADFLHPNTAQQVKCPGFVPKGSACFQFGGTDFFVFLAMPQSAAGNSAAS